VNKSLREKLESTFKDIRTVVLEDSRIAVTAENHSVLAILRYLKDAGFNHLALLSAVDWIEENVFELCFILTCYMRNNGEYTDSQRLHIILKTRIPREKPQFKTVTGIFPNAEPYEREIHELFGIKFEGHKRLTPLFLERDYEIPPFRKDFDTRKYVKEVFDNIPSIKDKDKDK
jgi:NADH-quinone oxidoreductase subunit C